MDHIRIGWRWLERTLNGIIDTVNRQKPVGSATIAVEESPSGALLKVVGQQDQQGGGGGGGGGGPKGGSWQQLAVIDDSSGTCVTKYLWYWGTSPTTNPTPAPS